jgi:Protein of unknown function (DUF3800)
VFEVNMKRFQFSPDTDTPFQLPNWAVARGHRYTWLVSSDESGIGGQQYYGFGSLWMNWERRGDFYREFMDIRRRHRMRDEWEVKWSNLDGVVRSKVAMDLADWFFRKPWLMFHCVVVRASDVNQTYHDGSFDLARRKHFAMLLTRKMKRCAMLHPDRPNYFRIWVDPIASAYRKAGEATQIIASHTLKQALKSEHAIVENLQERDSKATPSIQLCDLLLGAVMDAWQGQARKPEKLALAAKVASHLGWPDLGADTFPSERKFNIWYFHDGSRDRTARSRPVKLSHPLPRPRRR